MPPIDHTPWEDAMFAGIDSVLAFYEPFIQMKAAQNMEFRAPLGAKDLEQELRKVIFRCWEKQRMDTEIRNFDLLVKTCMDNALLTLKGREFCPRRGRCKILNFSQLEAGIEGEPMDVEAIIHNTRLERSGNGEYPEIVEEMRDKLDPKLLHTFDTIIVHDVTFLDPDRLTPRNRKSLSEALGISEPLVVQNIKDIRFVLQGCADSFLR